LFFCSFTGCPLCCNTHKIQIDNGKYRKKHADHAKTQVSEARKEKPGKIPGRFMGRPGMLLENRFFLYFYMQIARAAMPAAKRKGL